jgi:hypothetical protein
MFHKESAAKITDKGIPRSPKGFKFSYVPFPTAFTAIIIWWWGSSIIVAFRK